MSGNPNDGRLRILTVEDHEPFRRAICALLREKDFLLSEASDGLEAIETAIAQQPDVVLFDIGLPGLNGLEAAKRVLSLVPNVKVVFVTQESGSETVREAFRLGAQGYVQKHDTAFDLFAAIDAVVSGERFVSSSLNFTEEYLSSL
jgi:DNA-binding NarL/FixJ family response regulator